MPSSQVKWVWQVGDGEWWAKGEVKEEKHFFAHRLGLLTSWCLAKRGCFLSFSLFFSQRTE